MQVVARTKIARMAPTMRVRTTTTTTTTAASSNPLAGLFQRRGNASSGEEKRATLKRELKRSIAGTGRGVRCTEAEKQSIDAIARQLERLNPTKDSDVLGPALSARWLLEYTTSASILGTARPFFLRANGPIYQTIRAEKLEARNQETWPFFSAVEATLTPLSKRKVAVQFQTFYIFSLLPIKAPPTARGELEITYVDDDLRISRGDRGNLFVLSR